MEGAATPPQLRPQSGGNTPTPAKSPGGAQSGNSTPRDGGGRGGTGAEIYRALMEGYHRRLRAAPPAPSNDAAGLLYRDANFHGRMTPLKAKSKGPPDNYEPDFRLSKRLVPGKSHASEPALLVHNPTLNQSMDSAMFSLLASQGSRPTSASGIRPSLRVCEGSYRQSLQGGGLHCIAEMPPPRRLLKPGHFADVMQASTKPRVMVHAEDVAPAPGTVPSPRSFLDDTWSRQVAATKGSLANRDLPARPSTAPPNEARTRYHQVNSANKDLWEYRHSGGICPKDYKMDPSSRMPAPQLTSPSKDDAKKVYQTNQSEYALNRVRGLMSRVDAYA